MISWSRVSVSNIVSRCNLFFKALVRNNNFEVEGKEEYLKFNMPHSDIYMSQEKAYRERSTLFI